MRTVRRIGRAMILIGFVAWIIENFHFGWNWKPLTPEEAWWDAIISWMLILGFVMGNTKIILFHWKRRPTKAIRDINKERHEQIKKHGRTIELDVIRNKSRQLISAAVILTHPSMSTYDIPPIGWDKVVWDKMRDKPYRDRLVIAAALIAAEIDRLDNRDDVQDKLGADYAKAQGH